MNRFIKLFWFFSLLGFLGAILLVYSNLPVEVDVTLGSGDVSPIFLSRNAFFYFMIAVVVLTNGVLLALAKAVRLIKSPAYPVSPGISEKVLFKSRIVNWLGSFSFVLNLFYIVGVLFVGFHNDAQYVAPKSYSALVYGSILLILAWIFWLALIFLQRKKV